MIKTKLHSPPFPVNFKPALPNSYQTVDWGGGQVLSSLLTFQSRPEKEAN